MRRRGRPPYPDVLTPREWEVLGLLRERLSNEEIAERLGITLRTAKFHVSEILSKLGVKTREQAAAWQPEEAPTPARRWLAWPLAARTAGALSIVAAVVGLGLLAWGVLRTSDRETPDEPNAQGTVRIDSILPESGSIGDEIVIRGSGFDLSNNDIGFSLGAAGTAFLSGVASPDGRTLRFALEEMLGACVSGLGGVTLPPSQVDICPGIGLSLPTGDLQVAVFNRDGVSNSVRFHRGLSLLETARTAINATTEMAQLINLLDEFVRTSYQPSSGAYLASTSIGIHESEDGEIYVDVGIYGVGAAAIRDALPTEIAGYPVRIR